MTPMEAWANISQRLKDYVAEHGYTPEDVSAEVMAYGALKEAQEREDNKPLTLAQLREMDGEPVWVMGPAPLWALVKVQGDVVNIVSNDPEIAKADGWIKNIGQIYRYRPHP